MPRLTPMDLSRYLPLSNRPRADESGVSTDERTAIADVVTEAARVLALRPRLQAAFIAEAGLAGGASSDLLVIAETVRTGPRRRTRDLVRVVRALLAQSATAGVEPSVAPLVLGRVALHASTTASFDRRAVISGRTIRATDAEWQFGHGPALEDSALAITRFLLGLTDRAPQPAQLPPDSAPISPDATM